MIESNKNLLECSKEQNAICIATNSLGEIDPKYRKRWPEIVIRLSKCLKNLGTNIPFVIGALDNEGKYIEPNLRIIKQRQFKCLIFSFPSDDLETIENSAIELKNLVERFGLRKVAVELSVSSKAIVSSILDERFVLCG